MALRNIQVGDNLKNKTLFFSFPNNMDENIVSGASNLKVVIDCSNDNVIREVKFPPTVWTSYVYVQYNGVQTNVYSYNGSNSTLVVNSASYQFTGDVDLIVTSIDTSSVSYQYIFIEDSVVQPKIFNFSLTDVNKVYIGIDLINKIYKGTSLIYNQQVTPVGTVLYNRIYNADLSLGVDGYSNFSNAQGFDITDGWLRWTKMEASVSTALSSVLVTLKSNLMLESGKRYYARTTFNSDSTVTSRPTFTINGPSLTINGNWKVATTQTISTVFNESTTQNRMYMGNSCADSSTTNHSLLKEPMLVDVTNVYTNNINNVYALQKFMDLQPFFSDSVSIDFSTYDKTVPTLTIKPESTQTDNIYSSISLKVYAKNKVGGYKLNSKEVNLSASTYSDINNITSSTAGAVVGTNIVVATDIYGNNTSLTFELS